MINLLVTKQGNEISSEQDMKTDLRNFFLFCWGGGGGFTTICHCMLKSSLIKLQIFCNYFYRPGYSALSKNTERNKRSDLQLLFLEGACVTPRHSTCMRKRQALAIHM